MSDSSKKGLNISVKSFITAIIVIFALMVAAYILTLVIPAGEYQRIEDANGNLVVDTSAPFTFIDGGLPFWKWLLSPVLVLGASGSGALIAVIAFLLVIGGIFNALEHSGLIKYMLGRITQKFGRSRYRLLAIITFSSSV